MDLRLSIHPAWEEVEAVRDRCLAHLRANHLGEDRVQALAMVIAELTENAAQHSPDTGPGSRISVVVRIQEGSVAVEVENQLHPREHPSLALLQQRLAWIQGFSDPSVAYAARLREVARQGLDARDGGLGLVRIAHEGRSSLSVRAGQGSVVVTAIHHF